jgi:hypothetical protein
MRDWDAPDVEKILEACSHNTIELYFKSKEKQAWLRAMEKWGYELRVVKKGQCY